MKWEIISYAIFQSLIISIAVCAITYFVYIIVRDCVKGKVHKKQGAADNLEKNKKKEIDYIKREQCVGV